MYVCSNCLFCEAIEDEEYRACQLKQSLVMPYAKVCDFFELNRNSFKEVDKLSDEYTNTTERKREDRCIPLLFKAFGEKEGEEVPKVKILEQNEDDIIEYASMEGLREAIETMETEYEDDTSPRKPDFFGYTTTTPCECDYCNANSYPEAEELTEDEAQIELMIDDLDRAAEDVMEALSFLGDGLTPRDVLKPILGLEASIALLKRFLLEYEE